MLKLAQRLAYFRQDEPVGCRLIDVRHIPIEYLAIFFHHFLHIGDYLSTMRFQFPLFDSGHFSVSAMCRGGSLIELRSPMEAMDCR